MRKIGIFLSLIFLSAAFLFLPFSFVSSAAQSGTAFAADDGLIFSITTFNGKNESKPFAKCLGHTWLSLENQTGHALSLKDRELRHGESVTFSVWAISDHFGTVFNLEPAFIRDFGRYQGRVSLSVPIRESQIPVIEEYLEQNDRWALGKNCSYWSVQLWNAIVEEPYRLQTPKLVYTPERIQNALLTFDEAELDKDFSRSGEIYFYQNGQKTELQLCSGKKG